VSYMHEAHSRLMDLVEHEERRAREINERLAKRHEDETSPLRKSPHKVLPILTTRDIRAALTNDKDVLGEYWRRDAHMESLRGRDE
jgi:hypothetical protein